MSEHGDLWPGPLRARGAGEPRSAGEAASSDALAASDDADDAAGPRLPEHVAAAQLPDRGAAAETLAAAAGTSATASRSRSADTSASATTRRGSAARPALVWSIAGAVALVAVAATTYLLLRDDGDPGAAAPVPTVTTTLPVPTPATAAIDRGDGSTLFTSLPSEVRQYVLTAITPVGPAVPGGALETYDLTYDGDLAGGGASYTVHVEQWATPELAAAAAEALAAPLAPASSSGEVLVGDAVTGTFSLFGEAGGAREAGSAVWTNGTLVLQASGPALDIRNFYLAYGL